jgi:hypothetical protein
MINFLIKLYTECEENRIVTLIREFEVDFATFLNQYPITSIVEDFERHTSNMDIKSLIQEPSGLLQIALFTNALYIRLCENDSMEERVNILKNAFRDSISNQIATIITKSRHQFIALFELLDVICKICVDIKNNDIYILELPVGNSIPSFLLQNLLKIKGVNSILITISLNRNDSAKAGYTRKELIKDRLKELDLKSIYIVYIDEWISGSNFYNITKILSKIKDLKFIPGAFLLQESLQKGNYSKYKLNHDEICGRMGFNADSLRIQLSDLNHKITSEQKFVWTESDRLAGYRKLEFLGSITSTFFAMGEFLSENQQILHETQKQAISEFTSLDPETEIPDEIKQQITDSFNYFNSDFYLNLQEEIKNIQVDIDSIFDLEEETNKAILLLKSIKGYNNARIAINVISYYIRKKIISPSSRYFYKGFAPLCLPLEMEEKYLNAVFLEKIKAHNFQNNNNYK